MQDSKDQKSVTVRVGGQAKKKLTRIVEHENKVAETKLYNEKSLLDTLIINAFNALFGNKKSDNQ